MTIIKYTGVFIFSFLLLGCGGGSDNEAAEPVSTINNPPVALVGDDQEVNEHSTVTLSGAGTDDGHIVSYQWEQVLGVSVDIDSAASAVASFFAPSVDTNEMLAFQLTVTDNEGSKATATVKINIINATINEELADRLSDPVDIVVEENFQEEPISEVSTCTGIERVINVSHSANTDRLLLNSSDLYPGQVVSMDSVLTALPEEIRVQRNPIRLVIPTLPSNMSWVDVDEPKFSTVNQARIDLLNSVPDQSQPIAGNVNFKAEISRVEKQGMMNMNVSFGFDDFKANGGSSNSQFTDELEMVMILEQAFFTLKVDFGNDGEIESFLSADTTVGDIWGAIDDTDVPGIVSDVTYGRLVVVTISVSKSFNYSTTEIGAAFSDFLSGGASQEQNEIISKSQIYGYVYGGLASDIQEIKNSDDLLATTGSYDTWAKANTGLPLAFKIKHLAKNFPLANLGRATEYTYTEFLRNSGDFDWTVARIARDFSTSDVPKYLYCEGDFYCTQDQWGAPYKELTKNGINGLDINHVKDETIVAYTNVYNEHESIIELDIDGKALVVYIDGEIQDVEGEGPYSFNFPAGWSEIAITSGSQNSNYTLSVESLKGKVDIVDHNECAN